MLSERRRVSLKSQIQRWLWLAKNVTRSTHSMSLLKISRIQRYVLCRAGIGLFQCSLFALSGTAAFLLRFEFSLPDRDLVYLAFSVPVWVVVKGVIFPLLGLDRGGWRYVSIPDIVRLALGNVSGSIVALFCILFLAPGGFPRSIYVL